MESIPEEDDTDNGWYNNERPPRNKKKNTKTKTKLAPINTPKNKAPIFQEVCTTEDRDNYNIPTITQDEDDIISKVPRGLRFPMEIPVPRPTPRRSPRINLPNYQRANSATFTYQEALYEFLAHAMEAPKIFTPDTLKAATLSVPEGNVDLQEFCGGVSHPETGENITSYKALLKIPSLRDTWTKAMCKELGNISQGFGESRAYHSRW